MDALGVKGVGEEERECIEGELEESERNEGSARTKETRKRARATLKGRAVLQRVGGGGDEEHSGGRASCPDRFSSH